MYVDSGASDHITGDLEKLTALNKYEGKDQVHGADGIGMQISNIGHSTFRSLAKKLTS